MEIKYEELSEQNIKDAAFVHSVSWRTSHKDFVSQETLKKHLQPQQAEFLNKESQIPFQKVYVFYSDNKPAGILILNSEKNEIKSLYVLPEFWGWGVAKEIMSFALTKLDKKLDIVLTVMNINTRAQRFYEKFNFKNSGKECKLGVGTNKQELSEIEYKLSCN